jgi:hypothetical protein
MKDQYPEEQHQLHLVLHKNKYRLCRFTVSEELEDHFSKTYQHFFRIEPEGEYSLRVNILTMEWELLKANSYKLELGQGAESLDLHLKKVHNE